MKDGKLFDAGPGGQLAGLSGVAARIMSGTAVYPGPAGDPVQLLGAATKGWA